MSYIICQPCSGEKNASCVEVCPVDCIQTTGDADQYFIDPEECIDCGACVDTCPVDAIYPDDAVPERWQPWVSLNAGFFAD